MTVSISKNLLEGYEEEGLNPRVSLDWIAGYIREGKMEKINWSEMDQPDMDARQIDMPDDTLASLGLETGQYSAAVNTLLTVAFLIGGGE